MSISRRSQIQPGTAPRPGFEAGTGFLLSRLGTLVSRSWVTFLATHDLSQSQYNAIAVLAERGDVGQQDLARVVAVDPRNIVAVLNSLVRRKLIERRTDTTDRRRRTVKLTPAGRALAQRVAADAAELGEAFLHPLNAADRDRLNRLLQRLFDAQTTLPAPDG
jgi:DNA-binding MarR family transcriptional regulator